MMTLCQCLGNLRKRAKEKFKKVGNDIRLLAKSKGRLFYCGYSLLPVGTFWTDTIEFPQKLLPGKPPPGSTLAQPSSIVVDGNVSRLVVLPFNKTPDHDNNSKPSPLVANPIKEDHLEVVGPSQSVADIGLQAGSDNIPESITKATLGLQVTGPKGDVATAYTGNNETQVAKELPSKLLLMVPEATSAVWKGLKELSRVLEPATCMFTPIKEVVKMFTGCIDQYKVS
ncbi:hypothetical protein OPQ81_005111 [Rhizoctonia solani]|nr:hypothetical protein OPQ81_005111 [Rhizoctonia solani]